MRLTDAKVLDFEYGTSGNFSYRKCESCGLFNIDPVPDLEKLAEAYPENYHAYHSHNSITGRFLKQNFWRKKASRYRKFLNKDSAVFEIGCSFGDLLAEFRNQGFSNLRGLDFNPKAVEKAREAGLEVFQGELEDVPYEKGSFDMIIMENYIEHVYSPLEVLKKCNLLLSENGVLVGETPNTNSWDYRLFRRFWGGYHCPRHLYLFNTKNLEAMAQEAGFRVIRISNILQPAHWVLSVQNRLQDSIFKTKLKFGRSFYFPFLLILAIPLNLLQVLFSETSSVEFAFEKVHGA